MHKASFLVPLLLAPLLLAGCQEGAPWSETEGPAETETTRDFGPVSAYNRHLLFLGPGTGLPTAAVFDFAALSDSAVVRAGVRSRLLEQATWTRLMDAGWTLSPMREPWRIIPHGPLRLLVDDDGEIGSLAVEGDPTVRLQPGPLIAEASPDIGTKLVLRQASLAIDDDAVRGILLDAQLGRSVPATTPGAAPADTTGADTAATPAAGPDGTAADQSGGAADTAHAATPIARAGTQAFLADGSGYFLVLTRSGAGRIAWVSYEGRDEIRRGVGLRPVEADAGPAGPATWRIGGAGVDMAGELSTEAVDEAVLEGLDAVTALDYVLVSGWVEDRGARRDVFGLVRHVR